MGRYRFKVLYKWVSILLVFSFVTQQCAPLPRHFQPSSQSASQQSASFSLLEFLFPEKQENKSAPESAQPLAGGIVSPASYASTVSSSSGGEPSSSSDHQFITSQLEAIAQANQAATLPVPGTVPAITSIQLGEGLNLIGMPVQQARHVRSALASIEGQYTRVFGYDPTDQNDPWEVYDVVVPEWANDLMGEGVSTTLATGVTPIISGILGEGEIHVQTRSSPFHRPPSAWRSAYT